MKMIGQPTASQVEDSYLLSYEVYRDLSLHWKHDFTLYSYDLFKKTISVEDLFIGFSQISHDLIMSIPGDSKRFIEQLSSTHRPFFADVIRPLVSDRGTGTYFKCKRHFPSIYFRKLRTFLLLFYKSEMDFKPYVSKDESKTQLSLEAKNRSTNLDLFKKDLSFLLKVRYLLNVVFRDFSVPPDALKFGPGVCSDSSSALGSKMVAALCGKGLFLHYVIRFLSPSLGLQMICSAITIFSYAIESLVKTSAHSKGIIVPKNAKSVRYIASEPAFLSTLQQQLMREIDRCVQKHNSISDLKINFDPYDQTPNKVLAQEGSKFNSWATLDLSSASDLVTRGLVGICFPDKVSKALFSCNTNFIANPDGTIFKKDRISAMGSATTFRCFLITHAICVCAIREQSGQSLQEACKLVRSFGDDIIVPREFAEICILKLHDNGLKVNTSKSFINGPFRESCGGDYFWGHDVTPIRSRKALGSSIDSMEEYVLIHNKFFRANCYSEVLLNYLRRRVRKLSLKFNGEVPYGPDGQGFLTLEKSTAHKPVTFLSKRCPLKLFARVSPKDTISEELGLLSWFFGYQPNTMSKQNTSFVKVVRKSRAVICTHTSLISYGVLNGKVNKGLTYLGTTNV